MLLLVVSCGGPEALVINHVNNDGSIDRKIILTWDKSDFDLESCHVPIDSSWTLHNGIEVSPKGDTTWVLTAEKHFNSVAEINSDYNSYSGTNPKMRREAKFRKSFRWFNTVYYFSETIEGALDGYLPEDYFTDEELNLFYMPEGMVDELRSGSDSLRINELLETLEEKSETWIGLNLVAATINEIELFIEKGYGENFDIESFRENEVEIATRLMQEEGDEFALIDSVFGAGFYKNNKMLLDTSIAAMEEKFEVALEADSYLLQASMPGELIQTNGYIDNESVVMWKVDGESFLAGDYVMWAESKEVNRWAWIVTIAFLIFVISGVMLRLYRKR
jgi:hypothetical protein